MFNLSRNGSFLKWSLPALSRRRLTSPALGPLPTDLAQTKMEMFSTSSTLGQVCVRCIIGSIVHLTCAGAAAPIPTKQCPDTVAPPTTNPADRLVVDAGANQVVRGLTIVTLTAVQTNPSFNVKNLSFKWKQLDVTDVSPATGDSATFAFTVPLTNAIKRTFQVTVADSVSGTSATATVSVTTDNTKLDHPVIDSFTWTKNGGGTVSVVAYTELVDPGASMYLKLNNGNTQSMTRAGAGRWTFNAVKTPQPNSVTVTSVLTNVTPNKNLGTVTKTGLTAKKRGL